MSVKPKLDIFFIYVDYVYMKHVYAYSIWCILTIYMNATPAYV